MARKLTIKRDNTIASRRPDLLEEWDWERNAELGLDPYALACGSNKKAWWRCNSGHEWPAVIQSRDDGCGCPYCSGRRALAGFNDLATLNPELAAQWHPTKNGDRTPQMYRPQSGKKVWWLCDKGHEWPAVIQSRDNGCGCPYCAGKKLLVGFNDLATKHPQIAAEWNYEKNGGKTPSDYVAGSNDRVWWTCATCHGEWPAQISQRTSARARGCPFCAGQKVLLGFNDLATTHPDIAREWHPTLNGNLMPQDVTKGSSRKKVWWLCERGHEYDAAVTTRVAGCGCPYCAGKRVLAGFNDLATTHPGIAEQWLWEKNGDITPSMVRAGTRRKFWFRCERNHEWQAILANRTCLGQGCPYCAGQRVVVGENDLETCAPELAEEWHPSKNKGITPRNITKATNKKVWWLCPNGHDYKARVSNRWSLGEGCPYCNRGRSTSFPEKALLYYMRRMYGIVHANSHGPDNCLGRMSVDIWVPSESLCIEYDGYHWHQDSERDFAKDVLLASKGIRLVRVREDGCPRYDSDAEFVMRNKPFDDKSLEDAISGVLALVGVADLVDVDVSRDRETIASMVCGDEMTDDRETTQLSMDLAV